jgi:uracil-DNA glycosylase family 4
VPNKDNPDGVLPGQLGLFSTETIYRPDPSRLAALQTRMKDCRRCGLRATCQQVVVGNGNPNGPPVAIVGEGPGANEDAQGEPFVGPSGNLLGKMLAAIGLERKDVFVTNTVSCRPPGNRAPEKEEIRACAEWLEGQLLCVRPKVILAMGGPAGNVLTCSKKEEKVGSLRGKWHEWKKIPLRVTYHPAALLRNPGWKADAWTDLQVVQQMLKTLGGNSG